MKIIENNAQLQEYIPNVVSPVTGEDNLYTKITPHIDAATSWFFRNVCKEAALTQELMPLARSIVATEAFRAAVPSLNVILTANGFGIVSNNTTAPASKERTDSLIEALIAQRDNAIEQMVFELNGLGTLFFGTVFRGFEAQRLQGFTSHLMDKFIEQRPAILRLQTALASEALSDEVLQNMITLTYADEEERPAHLQSLFPYVQHILVRKMKGEEAKEDIKQVVTFIRKRPELFPEWEDSFAAKHWKDYSFKNDKKTGGFWL